MPALHIFTMGEVAQNKFGYPRLPGHHILHIAQLNDGQLILLHGCGCQKPMPMFPVSYCQLTIDEVSELSYQILNHLGIS